jgi:hypothetical protein
MQPDRFDSWPTPGRVPVRALRTTAPVTIRASASWFATRAARADWLALLAATRATLAAAKVRP